MQPDSPTLSHVWLLLSNALTAFLSVLTTLTAVWFRRKREPAEVAKIHAETRQININTDTTLIQAAMAAINKAERLQDERDHWERKAEAKQKDIDLLNIEVASLDRQMRRQMAFIVTKNLKQEYLALDQPDERRSKEE